MKDAEAGLVPPRYEPEPDNAPGAFYVCKHECIICGLPPQAAPNNICWSDLWSGPNNPDHCRVLRQPRTPEELEQVIEAAATSCVSAIRYRGTDAKVLARFREWGQINLCDAIENLMGPTVSWKKD